tara:strand:- start:1328 stop:1597 length:270 start_codon:yes stop_codon:yes gene_type:complete
MSNLVLDKTNELFYLGNKKCIHINIPEVFKNNENRWGKEAKRRCNNYGKSLVGSVVEREGIKYKVYGFEIMEGAFDYVGGLILGVNELK